MEESIIEFETAKLAKDKGFNTVFRNGVYDENGKFKYEHGLKNYPLELFPNYFSAPTQSLLQKWIREEHDINITVLICGHDYHQYILHDKNRKYIKTVDNPITPENHKNNYEDTLEKGLFEALKLIK